MALVFILVALTLLVLGIEVLMRHAEAATSGDPRDSFPRSVIATILWVAMLSPLFLSYA